MDEDDVRDVRETTNRLAGRLVQPRGLLKAEVRYMDVVQVSGVTTTLKSGSAFDPQEGAVVDVLFGPGIQFLSPFAPGDTRVAVIRNRSNYIIVGSVNGVWRQNGSDTVDVTTAQSQNTKEISFLQPFTAPPLVYLTAEDSTFRVVWRVNSGSITATGFTVNVATANGANFGSNQTISFAWEAVGR